MFDALETARVEALGARAMGGVRENLSYLTDARVRGERSSASRTADEVPLATAVGLMARERLTGQAPPRPRSPAQADRALDRGESRRPSSMRWP